MVAAPPQQAVVCLDVADFAAVSSDAADSIVAGVVFVAAAVSRAAVLLPQLFWISAAPPVPPLPPAPPLQNNVPGRVPPFPVLVGNGAVIC